MPMYPKNVGACIDLLYKNRAARSKLQKDVATMVAAEEALEMHIRELLSAQGLESGRGKLATATITHRTVGNVEDWNKLFAYVKRTGEFDLLQRRLNVTAYRERLDDKKNIPGVQPIEIADLSLTKGKN